MEIGRYIGEPNGFKFNELNGDEVTMVGREGVVVAYEKCSFYSGYNIKRFTKRCW